MISRTKGLRASILAAAAGALLVACGASPTLAETNRQLAVLAGPHEPAARIVPTKRPLQCVPFARKASGIQIRGDAWTWWDKAKGRYQRGRTPQVGAVLVMKKTGRLRRGHLAVVTRIVNERVIVVDQANWLNQGRIHLNTAVLDVSPHNNWSAVRVWYTPGGRYGARTYPMHGFIYPDAPPIRVASADAATEHGTAPAHAEKQKPRTAKPGAETSDGPTYEASGPRSPVADGPARPPARKPTRARPAEAPAHDVMRMDWQRG